MDKYLTTHLPPEQIDALRFQAFRTNKKSDIDAYYKAASLYFQERLEREMNRADRIKELEAKLERAVEASVEAVWAEYTDSIESKWTFRKEHVQNAMLRTLAELKGETDA
jgi:capsid protein